MSETSTLTFAVRGMHCASCGLLIDDTIEDLDGVRRSQTDARHGRTVVLVDPSRTTTSQIVVAIADAGYHAELIDP